MKTDGAKARYIATRCEWPEEKDLGYKSEEVAKKCWQALGNPTWEPWRDVIDIGCAPKQLANKNFNINGNRNSFRLLPVD